MINQLKILNFNTDGLENKIGEIETLIALIQPSIAVITDTRLKHHNLYINGYSLAQENSDDSFGGVLIAVRRGIAWKRLPPPIHITCKRIHLVSVQVQF